MASRWFSGMDRVSSRVAASGCAPPATFGFLGSEGLNFWQESEMSIPQYKQVAAHQVLHLWPDGIHKTYSDRVVSERSGNLNQGKRGDSSGVTGSVSQTARCIVPVKKLW